MGSNGFISINKITLSIFNDSYRKEPLNIEHNKIRIDNIKDIELSNLCLQTFPCMHDVIIITKDNNKYVIHKVTAPQIMFYFLKINKDITNHFNYYKETFASLMTSNNIYNYVKHYDNIDDVLYCNVMLVNFNYS